MISQEIANMIEVATRAIIKACASDDPDGDCQLIKTSIFGFTDDNVLAEAIWQMSKAAALHITGA